MTADLVVVAQEMPVVAGDVDRAHPVGAAESNERAAEIAMLPRGLMLDDVDQRLKGRSLGGNAADREGRELASNAKCVG